MSRELGKQEHEGREIDMQELEHDMKKMLELASLQQAEWQDMSEQLEQMRIKHTCERNEYEHCIEEKEKEIHSLKAMTAQMQTIIRKQDKALSQLEKQVKKVQQSLVFRVGRVVVSGVREPGLKTLLCPIRVLRLVRKHSRLKE